MALFLPGAAGCSNSASANAGLETITIAGESFSLELATDDPSRQQGLKHRRSIPDHGGMLFIFPDARIRSFWMQDCLVDIDLIFMDSRGAVTALHRMNVEPPRRPDESEEEYQKRLPLYSSAYPAQFAIELRAGWLDRLNLEVDQRVDLNLSRLKAMAR